MRTENIEGEMARRRKIIRGILNQDINSDVRGNSAIKYVMDENYSDIKNLFDNIQEIGDITLDFRNNIMDKKMAEIIANAIEEEYDGAKGRKLQEIIQTFFLKIFNKKRANAIVNILQPKNNVAYSKEGITSLQFEKSEILDCFNEENVKKEYLAEIQVNTLFWINKLTKLLNYAEINKLKARPIKINVDDNYLNAKKRTDILMLLDELYERDGQIIINEFSDDYEKKFGVKMQEDIEMLKDIKRTKNLLYEVKNILINDLLVKYFKSIKEQKDIPGIQGMGIKRNDATADDRVNSYITVIRMKGYSSNVYLHVPYNCYEFAVALARADGLSIKVPNVMYSKVEPDRVIPINVICKVDKKSKRYAEIKKEAESKKDNLVLRQAISQIKGTNLATHSKAKWDSCTIYEQDEINMELLSEELVEGITEGILMCGREWWEN